MTNFAGNEGCFRDEWANSNFMRVNCNLDVLLGGINNVIFDKQRINPTKTEMERVCSYFSLGDMRGYGQLEEIAVSPTNPIVFLKTAKGKFVIKLYPESEAGRILVEYALNQALLTYDFPTPAMHAGQDGKPFMGCNGRMAVCFSYVDGPKIFQCLHNKNAIRRVNTALLSLKNILPRVESRIVFTREPEMVGMINDIMNVNELELVPSTLRALLMKNLLQIMRAYKKHRFLFARQYLQTHANLSNFIICKETVYVLDLQHIRESYSLSDLASLVMHSFFFDSSAGWITNLVRDYFIQHQTDAKSILVLNVLLKFKLIQEYILYTRQGQLGYSLDFSPQLARSYRANLEARKNCILRILQKEILMS